MNRRLYGFQTISIKKKIILIRIVIYLSYFGDIQCKDTTYYLFPNINGRLQKNMQLMQRIFPLTHNGIVSF